MTCQCEQCSDEPQKTWTKAWLISCLGRAVARMGKRDREEFISKQKIETLRALYPEPSMSDFRYDMKKQADLLNKRAEERNTRGKPK
jgi:hypothetical protein